MLVVAFDIVFVRILEFIALFEGFGMTLFIIFLVGLNEPQRIICLNSEGDKEIYFSVWLSGEKTP